MPYTTTVYRDRLHALAQPGGSIYVHMLRTMMRIDARAKYYLEGVMVNKRTGNLLTSQSPPTIVTTPTQIVGTLVNTARYALFVHEGTREHEILPTKGFHTVLAEGRGGRRRGGVLRFTPTTANYAAGTGGGRTATGGPIFRPRVHHPGTAARPFLRRAMEDVLTTHL